MIFPFMAELNYEKFVRIWIDKEYGSPLQDVVGSTLLGTQEFIWFVKDKYLSIKKSDKELPALRTLSKRPTIEDIANQVDRVIKEESTLSRNIKLYLSQMYTGDKLDDIGRNFGIGGSGVCQAERRICDRIKKDRSLAGVIKKIERNLSRLKV
ncbi:hypothetical protein ACFL1Z_00450 [Thermodesulfobacteriota bacterium]